MRTLNDRDNKRAVTQKKKRKKREEAKGERGKEGREREGDASTAHLDPPIVTGSSLRLVVAICFRFVIPRDDSVARWTPESLERTWRGTTRRAHLVGFRSEVVGRV